MRDSKSTDKSGKSDCKKSYVRITGYEQIKIKQYCLKHHISNNRFMLEAAMYCIENDIPLKELFSNDTEIP